MFCRENDLNNDCGVVLKRCLHFMRISLYVVFEIISAIWILLLALLDNEDFKEFNSLFFWFDDFWNVAT